MDIENTPPKAKRGRKKKDANPNIHIVKKYFSSTLKDNTNNGNNGNGNKSIGIDPGIICIDVIEDDKEYDLYVNPIKNSNDDVSTESKKNQTIDTFKKQWNNNTSISCWNCCHQFESVPVGMPINFKNNDFVCSGIFCSFSCILRYSKDRCIFEKHKHHISHMFKTLSGKDPSEMRDAPFTRCLKIFGGNLSIEEYRQASETKIFKYIRYPMHLVRDYIEEIDLDKLKKSNDYIFKNCKSTGKKKNNIMDFLKSST